MGNIGVVDKVVRFIVGLLLIIVGLFAAENVIVQVIVVILGIIAMAEAFAGYCYLYSLFGINTCLGTARLWKVLAWIFALCGFTAYLIGWVALTNRVEYFIPTEFWFYDAIAAGVFALFFSSYTHNQEEKKAVSKRK